VIQEISKPKKRFPWLFQEESQE